MNRYAKKAITRNNASNSNAHLESNIGNAPNGKKRSARFNTPVRVIFTHYRKRFADQDNLSTKAVMDQLVRSGVLADDTPKQVQEVINRQIKTRGEEKTVITIEEI